MKTPRSTPSAKFVVKGAKLTRSRAEKISAVEGIKLAPHMAAQFAMFDKRGLSPEQRRELIRAEFAKKR